MLHPSYPRILFVSISTSNINHHFLTCGSTTYCNLLGLVCKEKGEKKCVFSVAAVSMFLSCEVVLLPHSRCVRCCGWAAIVIVVLTYMVSRVQTFVALILNVLSLFLVIITFTD